MLDIKRNNVIKTHLKLSQTFKELKTILPSGFIKTNIFSARVNPIRQQNILINVKNGEKNKDSEPKLNEIIQNNNEYAFSEGNKLPKKIISKISNYFSLNKQNNQLNPLKFDNNINFTSNENTHTPLNKPIIKIPKIKINLKYSNGLNNKEKLKSNSKLYYNDIKLNHTLIDIRKSFKGTTIDNSMMKSNIFLPSITERLKTNLPRYARENSGLLLKNYKNNYFDKNNNNMSDRLQKKINKKSKKFRVIKFNNKYANGTIKKNRKIQLTNSFLKNLKMDAPVVIKSIRKLRREQFYN